MVVERYMDAIIRSFAHLLDGKGDIWEGIIVVYHTPVSTVRPRMD